MHKKAKTFTNLFSVATIMLASFVFTGFVLAERASSTNYIIERDSINFGGGLGTSTNYSLRDTLGEVGTGRLSSTNYILKAGYRQLDNVYITITSPADVTLSPSFDTDDGGDASGDATWTVATNNSAGYNLYIQASTDPAMQSGTNNFSDYTRETADPDFPWAVDASDKEFGFSPSGDHIVDRYRDNGASCNIVSGSDTPDTCWDDFTTTDKTIASSDSATVSGTDTTVTFRAEAGPGVAPEGSYTATLTLTAVTQ